MFLGENLLSWLLLAMGGALAVGNLLIVAGVLAPALGGSLTALGEGTALAFSLLVGAVLLWFGYHVAVSARRDHRRPAVSAVGGDDAGEDQ